jgi:GTP-sensing pleiotropic transcriptional regulator CodY
MRLLLRKQKKNVFKEKFILAAFIKTVIKIVIVKAKIREKNEKIRKKNEIVSI